MTGPRKNSFNLPRAKKLATVIGNYLMQFCGQQLSPEKFTGISQAVARVLDKASPLTVVQSMSDLCKPGLALDRKLIRKTAWRLAANYHELIKGKACPLNTDEMPVHEATGIISVIAATRTAKNKPMLKVGFRIWTGPYAGQLICYSFPYKYASILYRQAATRPRKTKFVSPLLLSGFKCYITIGWYRDQPKVEKITFSSTHHAYNTDLLRKRFRRLAKCPLGQKMDCFACPLGRDQCDRAVRPKTYDIKNTVNTQRTSGSPVQQSDDDSSSKGPPTAPMVFS